MKPAVTCAVVALASVALSSQAPSPTFEVASVKRSTSDGSSGGVRPGPDGITARGASLFLLIRVAYNLQDHQIQGPAGCATTGTTSSPKPAHRFRARSRCG